MTNKRLTAYRRKKHNNMEIIIRNILLVFGVLFIIDFVREYPKTFENIDTTVDMVKDTVGAK